MRIPQKRMRIAHIPEGAASRPTLRLSNSPLLHSAAAMSKVCASCGKKPSFGNNRSHSMVATKRRFDPNLQRVRVILDGVARRAYICTRCLKAGKVQKAV
jgi:large subunit ribosomal protein L28